MDNFSVNVARIGVNVFNHLEKKTGKTGPKMYFVALATSKIINDDKIRQEMIESIKNSIEFEPALYRKYNLTTNLINEWEIELGYNFYNNFLKDYLDAVDIKEYADRNNIETSFNIVEKTDGDIIDTLSGVRNSYEMIRCFLNAFKLLSENFTTTTENIPEAMKIMIALHFTGKFYEISDYAFQYVNRIVRSFPDVSEEIRNYDFTELKEVYNDITKKLGIYGMEDI